MDAASTARAWLEAYNAKDIERLGMLITDNFCWSDPDLDSEMDRDAFLDAARTIVDQIPDRRIDLHELVVLNNYAVALSAEWHGTAHADTPGPSSETELHASESMVVEVEHGRVRFMRCYR